MNAQPRNLRFGAFLAPFHANSENPTLTLQRDMELCEHLDRLGYDEFWVGEHHSTGVENIGSPELLIAAMAERTRRIRMGTGVNSLSYHHPLILADRIAQLDHQTQGRIMFGAGPGQLPSDAYMMGIDPADQRRMMGESLEAILELFSGAVVSRETDWFRLCEARLQMTPYQQPSLPVVVASAITPSGAAMAGRLGLGMLSLAASTSAGFEALAGQWQICEEAAAKSGKVVDRGDWRITCTFHIAETREQAAKEAEWGIMNLVDYFRRNRGKHPSADQLWKISDPSEAVKLWTTEGLGLFGVGLVGTPDDIIERINQLDRQSGGFGVFLHTVQNVANFADTKKGAELFARYVIPAIRGSNHNREASLDWANAHAHGLIESVLAAQRQATEAYQAERER